ncbi:hypothetical protein FN846DRAFT_970874 [Sphaerosporella brunnea]|uniref:DUF4045 domain-containing protein n=1 Tax=Sphaerosporella brunnea TaxID=1250544 RepID=A0A5J5EIB1_9PEZI|nr:hypothetical protein FN846DRAFT_970874 [Sphaerosporella brunnea]
MEGNGEEVSDFLMRIRELGDKRDKEDEERARKLEAEILAGREARRARRDERARSLSPQKESPGGTPISLKSSISRPDTREGEDSSDQVDGSTGAALEKLAGKTTDATISGSEGSSGIDSARPAPVLSWQRRPKSIHGTYGLPKLSPTVSGADSFDSPEKSRAQIAASLGTKEPAWFRQTQERAATSGALRKAEDEGMANVPKTALPGMSPSGETSVLPSSTPEPQKQPPRTAYESLTSTRMVRSGSLKNDRFVASMAPGHEKSPSLASNSSGRFELDQLETLNRGTPMSPSQGRLSPDRERTPSPTKGFGGFVQSAMLKREGSVNKRWSREVTSPGHVRTKSAHAREMARDQESIMATRSRESTPTPEEVPDEPVKTETSFTRGRSNTTSEGLTKPSFYARRDSTPPASPTKTFEPKRWSPTKSSWLESALKKGTDNEPTLAPAKPLPPGKYGTTESLAYPKPSPTMHPKPLMMSSKPTRSLDALKKTSEKPPEAPTSAGKDKETPSKPAVADKPELFRRSTVSAASSSRPIDVLANKPALKPAGQVDFRGVLKPRPTTDKGDGKGELPFLNAMQRLKSTRTQNYKATDELKERILEGKANLNTTGGPQKSVRKDPLKESLISVRGSLRHSDNSPKTPTPSKPLFSPVDSKPSVALSFEKKVSAVEAKSSLIVEKKVLVTEPKPSLPLFEKRAPVLEPKPNPSPFEIRKAFAPGRIDMEKKVSSLADRFNPNLASLLQRGPPAVSSGNAFKAGSSEATTASIQSKDIGNENTPKSSGPLSHMTKGRARGPKRRAPTKEPLAVATSNSDSSLALPKPTYRSPSPVTRSPSPMARGPSPQPVETSKRATPSPELTRKPSSSSLQPVTPQKSDKPKPPTPAKSPLLRSTSASSLKENEKFLPGSATIKEEVTKTPPLIRTPSSQLLVREPSVGSLRSSSSPAPKEEPPVPVIKAISPIRLPKRDSDRKNFIVPGFLGLSTSEAMHDAEDSKPMPRLFSRTVTPLMEPEEPITDSGALDKDNALLLSQFFKGPAFRANKIDFDVMNILASSPAIATEKIKTAHFDVSDITGNGKLNPVPKEQQHVFFDESMYLCTHRFESAVGKQEVEVYLWSGAKVSESAIEDAQLFARKTARENEGKLVLVKQGRETPTFFQAIGGILVTRRGTRERSSVDSSYMLCGRNYSGGVAFDEVDMQVSSLCSGFPYVVCRKGGVYLWKGKGATQAEVGVARLVSFEISGGEVKECTEGDEPDDFFDVFGGYSELKSANYWNLRPSSKRYAARLFRMDLQAKSKVAEISPFCQDDLDPREIYVADAFFEFYIVIGSQSQSKREEFQAALQFTQEYAILSVSVEDRPFIPVSSVILGGAPREFKALFRTWDNAKMPTQWQPARKPSLRLIGLPQAMEAMNVPL